MEMIYLLFSHIYSLETHGQELATKRITIHKKGDVTIDLHNKTGYIHTQDYCPTGLLKANFNNSNKIKLTYNNVKEIKNDIVNISYYDQMGGYFVFDLFVLDESIHCDNVYSVSNIRSIEIFGNKTSHDCYLINQISSTTASIISCEVPGSIFYQENDKFGNLSETKLFGKHFMIGITGNSSVKLETKGKPVSDWQQVIRPYVLYNGNISNNKPKASIGTRVEWWVWLTLFGVPGILLIAFISFLCTPAKDSSDKNNYYWLSGEEYVISTQFLIQNED